ncbi:prefoldin subunit 2 [Schizosaccharomyces japonicus yFS275]|uniref:Prefoldin subunit 2 n=1 Tax=Schizosaccharomyces japonicus (strain yFS275 / FY16936) TaxID=402676 RepID=B6JVW3_SCHJY|nr:prefoldin subunit 2 [Schizosaccharomyces japonicus yFS275]EEB05514.1 prefoldin subunit 2 [Schizosaccharomyces japonicus yFS275]
METDLDEHKYVFHSPSSIAYTYSRLVIDTLEKTDKDRKCYRMINGVLAERKVETVLPILQTTSNGVWNTYIHTHAHAIKQYVTDALTFLKIKTAMERLVEQYKQLEKEFNEFQKKNHIQVIRQ